MGKSKLGENCSLGQNVFVADDVILGNNVKVQNNVSIYSGVICEDDVFLGPSMVFTNVINPRSAIARKEGLADSTEQPAPYLFAAWEAGMKMKMIEIYIL